MGATAKITNTLCLTCNYHRQIISGKGSLFIHCGMSYENPTKYPKYPSQPVLTCDGYLDITERNG